MIRWLFLCLSLTSCAPNVVYYIKEGASFKNFSSYAILPPKYAEENEEEKDELFKRIETAINYEMKKRDYVVNRKTPNLVVKYELISSSESSTQQNTYPGLYGGLVTLPISQTFTQSTLVFEMLELKSKKLIWQASIDVRELDQQKSKDLVVTAVMEMYRTYLYRAGTRQPDETLQKKDKEGKRKKN